jgi:hypothetical protein
VRWRSALAYRDFLMWKMPWLQSACAAYWGWILKRSAMHWSIFG